MLGERVPGGGQVVSMGGQGKRDLIQYFEHSRLDSGEFLNYRCDTFCELEVFPTSQCLANNTTYFKTIIVLLRLISMVHVCVRACVHAWAVLWKHSQLCSKYVPTLFLVSHARSK